MTPFYIIGGIALLIYVILKAVPVNVFYLKQKPFSANLRAAKVEIIDLNGIAGNSWHFKFKDEMDNNYFVMSSSFYQEHGLKFPITKFHLDAFLPGVLVNIEYKKIIGKNVVIKVCDFLVESSNI